MPSAARSRWARLIGRSYEVSPLACPGCGAEMRILAFLTDLIRSRCIMGHPHDRAVAVAAWNREVLS